MVSPATQSGSEKRVRDPSKPGNDAHTLHDEDDDFERLRLSSKRVKTASAAIDAKDTQVANLLKEVVSLCADETVRRKSFKQMAQEYRALYASYDHLMHSFGSIKERRALEAEIAVLRQEKTSLVQELEENLAGTKAVEDKNGKLKEEVAVLRGQVEDGQASLRAEQEQNERLEDKHKKILKSFNDYKKRLRSMGNE